MIEEGKLDEIIAQHRSQSPRSKSSNNQLDRGGRRNEKGFSPNARPNPFERPTKPDSQLKDESKNIEEEEAKSQTIEENSKSENTVSENNQNIDVSENKDLDNQEDSTITNK